MAYVTRAQIETEIPAGLLIGALDDDRDGAEDEGLFDRLVEQSDQAVDAILAGRYDVPFTGTVPAAAAEASRAFLGELIYLRREVETNPFSKRADFWRRRLAEMAAGKGAVDGTTNTVTAGGALVSDNASIDSQML